MLNVILTYKWNSLVEVRDQNDYLYYILKPKLLSLPFAQCFFYKCNGHLSKLFVIKASRILFPNKYTIANDRQELGEIIINFDSYTYANNKIVNLEFNVNRPLGLYPRLSIKKGSEVLCVNHEYTKLEAKIFEESYQELIISVLAFILYHQLGKK